MKKVLFISSRPLFPIIGGDQIRTVQQYNYLKENYDTDVLYITNDRNDLSLHIRELGENHVMQCYMGKFNSILETLKFLFNQNPLQVNYYFNRNIKKQIDSIINEYDIIFCNNIRTAQYVIDYRDKIRVLDFVDAISMNYEKARKNSSGLKRLIYNIDYKRCLKYEHKCIDEFNALSIISEVDKSFLNSGSKEIHIIQNKVEIPLLSEVNTHKYTNRIVFIGKMSYEPNVLAVSFFVEKVFKSLKKSFNELEFVIVGAHPTQKVYNLTKTKGVTVTGYVDSVIPFIQNSTIVVAPMQSGAGIQNKIIQAMAYECCVATSPIGVEGLEIKDEEIAIFETEEEWINGITYLLLKDEIRRNMGEKARQFVVNNLSEEVVRQQFKDFMSSINI